MSEYYISAGWKARAENDEQCGQIVADLLTELSMVLQLGPVPIWRQAQDGLPADLDKPVELFETNSPVQLHTLPAEITRRLQVTAGPDDDRTEGYIIAFQGALPGSAWALSLCVRIGNQYDEPGNAVSLNFDSSPDDDPKIFAPANITALMSAIYKVCAPDDIVFLSDSLRQNSGWESPQIQVGWATAFPYPKSFDDSDPAFKFTQSEPIQALKAKYPDSGALFSSTATGPMVMADVIVLGPDPLSAAILPDILTLRAALDYTAAVAG